MHLNDVLARLARVTSSGTGYTAQCPAHDDRRNSLSVRDADGRILLYCHAGCAFESVVSAIGITAADLAGPAPRTAGYSAPRRRSSGVDKPSTARRGEGLKTDSAALYGHSLNAPETVYRYEDETGRLLFEVCRFNTQDGGKTFRQRQVNPDGDVTWGMKGVTPVLYRLPELRREIELGAGVIYVCEGEKDADALVAADSVHPLCATTAPMGAGKWREQYTEALQGAQLVYLLPDNDEAGRAHMQTVATLLEAAGVPALLVDFAAVWPGIPEKGDVYDVLAYGGLDLFGRCLGSALSLGDYDAAITRRLRPYDMDAVGDYLLGESGSFFDDMERSGKAERISTGFSALDSQLDGRLYSGLYVVGSVSSLGKTAFCGQLADNIAAQGRDVMFFTLEMSRYEMMSRALIRELFRTDPAKYADKNMGHVYYGAVERRELRSAAASYADRCGAHLSYIEGNMAFDVAALCERVRRHADATGRAPVVFVDYLQVLSAADSRMSDKQATDYNVLTLKRLSRELDAPVIAVSSFNRQSYQEDVSFASFKESGAIEYSADFILGFQAAGVAEETEQSAEERRLARAVAKLTKTAKLKDPRPIEAVTLKNRRGPAYARFELMFYARQNYFAEV